MSRPLAPGGARRYTLRPAMAYSVKEIFYTLQGEGARAGRPAVFCRFAGCNLWTGREQDRARAVCQFCDTDFVGIDGVGGGRFADADALADAVASKWPGGGAPYVVCTGGEPLLQLDAAAIGALHARGFEIAIETNGTIEVPPGIDWICVSPKAGSELVVREGHELKLVFPQEGLDPASLESLRFEHFYLQPMDDRTLVGPGARSTSTSTKRAIEHCLAHPRWSLSLQTHKLLGIP
nr:7-carboxy-7-deazaguanine synthase [Sandaracinus amylolyticus]